MKDNLNHVQTHLMFFGRRFSVVICNSKTFDTFLTSFYFSETQDGLRPGKYVFTLGIFLIFMIFPFWGGNISCAILFDDQGQEDFREPIFDDTDREDFGELISMPG